MGKEIDEKQAEADCDPIMKNKDIDKTIAFDGVTPLVDTDIAYPCGLIAKSFFDD